jgi:hypothetical protein
VVELHGASRDAVDDYLTWSGASDALWCPIFDDALVLSTRRVTTRTAGGTSQRGATHSSDNQCEDR